MATTAWPLPGGICGTPWRALPSVTLPLAPHTPAFTPGWLKGGPQTRGQRGQSRSAPVDPSVPSAWLQGSAEPQQPGGGHGGGEGREGVKQSWEGGWGGLRMWTWGTTRHSSPCPGPPAPSHTCWPGSLWSQHGATAPSSPADWMPRLGGHPCWGALQNTVSGKQEAGKTRVRHSSPSARLSNSPQLPLRVLPRGLQGCARLSRDPSSATTPVLDADGKALGLGRPLADEVGAAGMGLEQVVCLLPLHVACKPTGRGQNQEAARQGGGGQAGGVMAQEEGERGLAHGVPTRTGRGAWHMAWPQGQERGQPLSQEGDPDAVLAS